MAGKIKNYFAGGNTARGFYSLYDSNLHGLKRLFILKGGPGTGKSTLMKDIGNEWISKGYDVEFIHCASDNDSIDGVIITALQVGVVDGTAPHVIEPRAAGAIEQYVNIGEAWDSAKLSQYTNEILEYNRNISEHVQTAYKVFAEALAVHDEWEKIYIESMDFNKAQELTDELMKKFYGNLTLNKASNIKHRFLGAATPKGAVDFIANLTEDIQKRYFIKGRPGSGKSTMLKKLAAEAEKRGLDIEIYHCGFDPNSLDMVIIRELGLAIFDSTAPHEYFPSRDGDEIVDMYEKLIMPGTDEIFAEQIAEISSRYKAKMKEATSFLAKAKSLHDELETIYIDAVNFEIVNDIKEKIKSEINLMSN